MDENDEISFLDLDAVVVVSSLFQWRKLRKKDERIFAENWSQDPTLAGIFRMVF